MDVMDSEVPDHIAMIMDGNGRWAQARGLPRTAGHAAGVQAARHVVRMCRQLGVRVLTLYTFSVDNWKRPRNEVDFLMRLCREYAEREVPELRRNAVRLNVIGRCEDLPPVVRNALEQAMRATQDGERMVLNLAINYGGRAEITDAVRSLARAVQQGKVDPEGVTGTVLERFLYTAGMPDPDLVIRTGGEQRLSNFLLWQTAGAVFWSTPTCWPDFDEEHLQEAIRFWRQYRRREAVTDEGSTPE